MLRNKPYLGLAHSQDGPQEAFGFLRQAIEQYPNLVPAYRVLADVYVHLHRSAEAEALMQLSRERMQTAWEHDALDAGR